MDKENNKLSKYDLEERLINFAVRIIKLCEKLPNTPTGNHISGQLARCGTSPAPNYGEAQGAESRNDFIHKIRISLKELRETKIWLKIIQRLKLINDTEELENLIKECEELVLIFAVSVKTAEKNKKTKCRET